MRLTLNTVYRFCTSGLQPHERERFDALLDGQDYDRERRRREAALIAARRG